MACVWFWTLLLKSRWVSYQPDAGFVHSGLFVYIAGCTLGSLGSSIEKLNEVITSEKILEIVGI